MRSVKFARAVRDAMNQRGVSKSDLAKGPRVPAETIHRLLRYAILPTYSWVLLICKFLELNIDDVVEDEFFKEERKRNKRFQAVRSSVLQDRDIQTAIGTSRQNLYQMINSPKLTSVRRWVKLAKVLNMNIEDLVFDDGEWEDFLKKHIPIKPELNPLPKRKGRIDSFIAQERRKKRMTQAHLAYEVGVCRRMVSRMETKGIESIRITKALLITKALSLCPWETAEKDCGYKFKEKELEDIPDLKNMEFNEALLLIMKRRQTNISKLVNSIGVNQSNMRKYSRTATKPKFLVGLKIAHRLGVDPYSLYGVEK